MKYFGTMNDDNDLICKKYVDNLIDALKKIIGEVHDTESWLDNSTIFSKLNYLHSVIGTQGNTSEWSDNSTIFSKLKWLRDKIKSLEATDDKNKQTYTQAWVQQQYNNKGTKIVTDSTKTYKLSAFRTPGVYYQYAVADATEKAKGINHLIQILGLPSDYMDEVGGYIYESNKVKHRYPAYGFRLEVKAITSNNHVLQILYPNGNSNGGTQDGNPGIFWQRHVHYDATKKQVHVSKWHKFSSVEVASSMEKWDTTVKTK